ncbi:MAG: hypothetical protein QXX84_01755 [Sulfolobales archaeon]
MVVSRDFCLAHRDPKIPMGSWAAVESKGTRLPSSLCPRWLGALLPSPPGACVGRPASRTPFKLIDASYEYQKENSPQGSLSCGLVACY